MLNKVSVIIPYYNNSKTIHRALESIVIQGNEPREIIVINDASPDWDVAQQKLIYFSRLPIQVLHHKINQNGAAARNSGILAAKGEFIAFLDADDEWKPNHLKNLINVLQDQNGDVAYSSCTVLSKNNFQYTLPNFPSSKSKNIGEYLFADSGFIQTSCLMLKSDLAMKVQFNPELIRHQDYDFLLRLEAEKVKFKWSSEPTVIVHWENNDIDKKGGTMEYSLNWYKTYKSYLSQKGRSNFILKFVVMRSFQQRKIMQGASNFFFYCKPWDISIKNYYFLISTILFGSVKLLSFGKNNK